MKQLSGMDASFLYFETPNAPGHVFSVWIYDQSSAPGGKVTFKGILEHVSSRLNVSRTFRQRLPVHRGNLRLCQRGEFVERAARDSETHARDLGNEKRQWRDLIERLLAMSRGIQQRECPLIRHEAVRDGEIVAAGAAQPAHMPGVLNPNF